MRRQLVGGVATRVIVLAVLVGALVTGCGSGPDQFGAAVIVGSEAVPTRAVQARLDQIFARPDVLTKVKAQGITTADVTRDLVTQTVVHSLSEEAAQRYGIVVTDADIDAELADLGGTNALLEGFLGDLPTLRERVWDQLVAERLATLQMAGLSVTVDIIGAPSRTDAEAAAKLLAAGGPAAEAYFAENPETSLRDYEYRASANPDVALSPIFSTPVGGAGWFAPTPGQDQWFAYRVLDRRTDAPPVAPELDIVGQYGKTTLAEIGLRLLQPVADEVGVRVNPRYGTWDPISLRVLDEEQVAGGLLLPAPTRP